MLKLSCQHQVEDCNDEYVVTYKSYGDYGQRVIEHASLCKECYDQVVKDCLLLYTEEEEMEWLNGCSRMKYAIKIPFEDGWLYATEYDMNNEFSTVVTTYDNREDAEGYAKLWKGSIVVEYTETDRLQAKKKQIHDELYDKVKMEMFKASSKLEGIDYDE